ncbi:helix-turn-helix domain-containing protein [[Kitasatospora] papulosa]|uniref:helix-turn-helix domain-containing protein n=1 Tax=[Kitasatospora] papulosa TaxID=1464011 RepID=UPI00368AF717
MAVSFQHAELDREGVGQRIATIRRARRMTQADLARAAYVSLATIKGIERGARSPSDDTFDSIAAALAVDPSHIIVGSARTDSRVHAALPAISAAIAAYDIPTDDAARPLDELGEDVGRLVQWRLAAQYARIAEQTPHLLTEALTAFHHSTGTDRLRAARLLATTTRSADAVAFKFGARDLSARLIELMRWAADRTEDPITQATAAYVRTETFFAARAHTAGLRALEQALDACPSPVGPASTAARGALHMRAAVIAGRYGNTDRVALHLAQARRLGDSVREGAYDGTQFGPDSVRAHEVSVAVSLGQDHLRRALDVADEWTPPNSLPQERQSGFWIELARAQVWAGRPDDAFESLKAARFIAPQHTREHPWARESAATIRRLKRTDAQSLTSFAEWIGAV